MRQVWTEEKIKSAIFESMKLLNIERMPTSVELVRKLGRNDLHIKICRTKKYEGWANHLGLERKVSNTLIGQNNEGLVTDYLRSAGHVVERMSTGHPYDLLVNGVVKVDVKTGGPSYANGSRVHTFGLSKKDQTCDLYVCIAIDQFGNFERTFVIPSHLMRVVTLCIGKESKYNRFIDRWDLIERYSTFLKDVV